MMMVLVVVIDDDYALFRPSPLPIPTPVIRACAIAFFLLVEDFGAFTKGRGFRSVLRVPSLSRAGWVVFPNGSAVRRGGSRH